MTTSMVSLFSLPLLLVLVVAGAQGGKVCSIEDFGAASSATHNYPPTAGICLGNAKAISEALSSWTSCSEVLVPEGKIYYIVGGIFARDMVDLTFRVDGELYAYPLIDSWPLEKPHSVPRIAGEGTGGTGSEDGRYSDVLILRNTTRLHVTGKGKIDGGGVSWWNKEILPQVFGHLNASRPALFRILESYDLVIDSIWLHNSPSWTLLLQDIIGAEAAFLKITVDRQKMAELKTYKKSARKGGAVFGLSPEEKRALQTLLGNKEQADGDSSSLEMVDASTLLQLSALEPEDLNTDGIDITGSDVYVHDCYIENDDDSIAVKPCGRAECTLNMCTENIRIENSVMTGFGASIGSVSPTLPPNPHCVRNVVFQNISMPETGKGIYVKSNPSCQSAPGVTAIIENILFENFTISSPRWWPIWIGPQQQHEPHVDLGEKCALTYPLSGVCPTQGCVTFRNITLRNVDVTHPWLSAGVILGNSTHPMEDIVMDGVIFHQQSRIPFGKGYKCENVHGVYRGGCVPEPVCLEKE